MGFVAFQLDGTWVGVKWQLTYCGLSNNSDEPLKTDKHGSSLSMQGRTQRASLSALLSQLPQREAEATVIGGVEPDFLYYTGTHAQFFRILAVGTNVF